MLTLTKKIIKVLLVFTLLFNLIVNSSYALVKQSEKFFVNDTANILSDETEKYIMDMNQNLEAQTGAQIVVVTVTSLDGLDIQDYATQLFREYGIGDKTKNNGILFLVSTGERKVRIEVGYGLEGRINDGKAGRILDNYVVPYFKNDDWDNGIKNGFNAILEEVSAEYNITVDGAVVAVSNSSDISDEETTAMGLILPLLIFCIFARFKAKTTGAKWLLAGGATIITTVLQCIIAGGTAMLGMFLMMNFFISIVSMFGTASGGGYYGGGYHGGGFSGGRRRRRIPRWWRFFRRWPEQAEDFKIVGEIHMKKFLKNFCLIIIILGVLNLIPLFSYALVEQSDLFYVNDKAGILNSETYDYILAASTRLHSKTNAQIVVVTVKDLEGLPIEDYAVQLFRKYEIGDKEKNNGILFLISTGDRKVRIEIKSIDKAKRKRQNIIAC